MKRLLRFITVMGALAYLSLLLFMPSLDLKTSNEDNYFEVFLNGSPVGLSDSEESARACLRSARRNAAFGSDQIGRAHV